MNTDLNSMVVVVDDHRNMRETLTYVLESSGIAVATGTNGVEGLEAIKRYKPKVVLLALEMPRMDGYEVCREIRRTSDLVEAFVLVLTARGQSPDPVRALDVGVDLHMPKPFDDEPLIEVINEVFEGRLAPRQHGNSSDGHVANVDRVSSTASVLAASTG